MKVLSVASECAPLVKTGGLADVVGALPAGLEPQGVDMRTLLPGYRQVMAALSDVSEVLREEDFFGGPGRVLAAKAEGLALLVVDAPHLFDRDGRPYIDAEGVDWEDNAERFAALSWMAAKVADEGAGGWFPDLLHAHDWQAGFAPVYMSERKRRVPSIITIHNIAFQGLTAANMLEKLRLPRRGFAYGGFEYYGKISALKAGIVYSDKVTTVSPTYAAELLTPDFGMGLDGVLRERSGDLVGILNGIDEALWDPKTDAAITPYKTPKGKEAARAVLEEEFTLPEGDGPIAIVVSRLTEQKGLDILLGALPGFLARGGRLALLGAGDKTLEDAWRKMAERYHAVSVKIGYDEPLAHRMMAGGDAILVPSRFEPCGLTQMYGLRYGTVPVVARTGGLADTVIDANDAAIKAGVGTGILFDPGTPEAMVAALDRLIDLHSAPRIWAQLQRNGMRHTVGWDISAGQYAALYQGLLATS